MGKRDKESFVLTPDELKQVRRERKKALKAASNEETEKLLKQQKNADKAAKKATKANAKVSSGHDHVVRGRRHGLTMLLSYDQDGHIEEDKEEEGRRQPPCPWPDQASVELIQTIGARKQNGKWSNLGATNDLRFAKVADLLNASLDDKSRVHATPRKRRQELERLMRSETL